VPPGATIRRPATSTLPRLATELPADLYLVDPGGGAAGMALQIRELQELLDLPRLALVDTGGDVLARGDEPGLRSPLADALSLTAASAVDPAADVLVAAPGLDGELDRREVGAALADVAADAPALRLAGTDYAGVAGVFRWHPSEVTGLVFAAARGDRGGVRSHGSAGRTVLTDGGCDVWRAPVAAVRGRSRLAGALDGSTSLADAEQRLAELGYGSELEQERRRAAHRHAAQPARRSDQLAVADLVLAAAEAAGQRAATLRSIAEAVAAAAGHVSLGDLSDLLAADARFAVRPPLVSRSRGDDAEVRQP
jgi:hypothetical protein